MVIQHVANFLYNIIQNPGRPVVGTTLLAAGFVPTFEPTWFDASHLQALYFMLLIPPAAYHCYGWFKQVIWPKISTKWRRKKTLSKVAELLTEDNTKNKG